MLGVMFDLATDGFSVGLLVAAVLFGLRHGIDWDHIAAITDIAATQESPRQGIRLGTVYVLAHAAVVFALGVLVITIGGAVPDWLDDAMGKIVGWTLLILGAYVVVSLIRNRGDFRMRSRWMLIFAGIRRTRRFLRSKFGHEPTVVAHDHPHVARSGVHHSAFGEIPAARAGTQLRAATHRHHHVHIDGDTDYGVASIAVIGMLHGVGAETPTQIVIFLAAAHAGGIGTGVAVLVAFILGLVISNSVITVASTVGFRASARNQTFHVVLGSVTAVVSIVVGTLFVFGADATLPVFFAG